MLLTSTPWCGLRPAVVIVIVVVSGLAMHLPFEHAPASALLHCAAGLSVI
jgi:hypothetical protein